MASAALLLLFTVGSVFAQVSAERNLVYVTVLFRHGDRSPIKTYPTNPNQESDWPQGFGQLSQEGMRQHFKLGQFLKTRYKNFLSESYSRHEIYVRSTDFDRTLMSAAVTLAGLYPPSGRQVFMPDLKWQPIPVHTVSRGEEKLLTYPLGNCPRYTELMNETKYTEEYINVTTTNQYQDLIELLRNKTGVETVTPYHISFVHDTLFCESLHNMSTPDWVTPEVMENLKVIKDFLFQTLFGVHKQQEKSRLQGGILLGEIVKNLTKMAVPDPKQRLKMIMLSAHDTAIAALHSSLNVYNGLLPPYASSHIIELYREDNGSASVSMFYRNDSTVNPYQLQLPGCSLDCPLEEFVRITKLSVSEDRDKECQLASQEGVEAARGHPQPYGLTPLHYLLGGGATQKHGKPTRKPGIN